MAVTTKTLERNGLSETDIEDLMGNGPRKPGIKDFFTQEELDSLKAQGYEPVRYIGSGYTRDVFETIFRRGALVETRALKVLKRDLEERANLLLKSNLARFPNRDVNAGELACVSNLGYHPNIVRIIDVLDIGRAVTVEEFVDGQNLEELVNTSGKLGKDQFKKTFTQVLDGIGHMHNRYGASGPWIWRDGKASNILIDRRGNAKIDDLQTAKPKSQIQDKVMPTMGGGGYPSPLVINALLPGKENRCSERTDLHSVGVCMYLASVGRKPFEFKIKEDPNGTPYEIDGQMTRISIYDGNKRLPEGITPEYYKKKLKRAMKAVPRGLRSMIGRCLSLDNPKYDIYDLKGDFERTDAKQSFFDFISRYKTGLITGGVAAAVIGALALAHNKVEVKEISYAPTIQDLLDRKQYISKADFGPSSGTLETPLSMLKDLRPYVEDLREHVKSKEMAELRRDLQFITRRQDTKELEAVLSACKLADSTKVARVYKRENRSANFAVPLSFFKANSMSSHDTTFVDITQEKGWAFNYLCGRRNVEDRIEDVFAKYFCSDEEIVEARKLSNSSRYFPNFEPIEGINGATTLKKGYKDWLNPVKAELIDRAIAYYLATDKKGQVQDSLFYAAMEPATSDWSDACLMPVHEQDTRAKLDSAAANQDSTSNIRSFVEKRCGRQYAYRKN